MSRDPVRAGSQFFGGRVCLDFANTLDWRLTDSPVELIPDYAALLGWCGRRGILPARALAKLRTHGVGNRAHGAVICEAHLLRAEIWAIAEDLIAGRRVRPDALNSRLSTLPSQPGLLVHASRHVFDLDGADPRQPLWPVLWSLTAVLASEDAARVGRCQAHGCGWYFIDESPNHSRTWCSSEVCGNRERVRRAYARRCSNE